MAEPQETSAKEGSLFGMGAAFALGCAMVVLPLVPVADTISSQFRPTLQSVLIYAFGMGGFTTVWACAWFVLYLKDLCGRGGRKLLKRPWRAVGYGALTGICGVTLWFYCHNGDWIVRFLPAAALILLTYGSAQSLTRK